MQRTVQAAFFAAGALGLLIVARRTESRWERFFAVGLAAIAAWSCYEHVAAGGLALGAQGAYVWLALTSLSVAGFVAALATAKTVRQRLTASALLLYAGIDWWTSIGAARCGRRLLAGCHPPSVWLISSWAHAALLGAAMLMLAGAFRRRDPDPPHRFVALGFASFMLTGLYVMVTLAVHRVPGAGRILAVVQAIGFVGALVCWLIVAKNKPRPVTTMLGVSLSLVAIPYAWPALESLFR